ncbi:ankyrin repeat domain-containing protein [Bordetella sp. FB-8]|uniref:ankyrin repeat domain-containing protein n=1 Tax=Bordetella sp. FB-8 TaxID=1159870 RepID=UPI000361ACAA|nr:ankyrin repeat domain-containing protein [Bordetella sp. FB-8]
MIRSSVFRRCLRDLLVTLCMVAPFWSAMAAQAPHAPPDWWIDIENDRVDAVRADLARGADPNLESPKGQPALLDAVASGSWKAFDALLADPRTDVNIENALGETPLMYVAIAGDIARAQALLARGARVNKLGWTPLHYAASKGQIAMIKLLLAHDAMPNAPSPDGVTPLMMAAYADSRQAVQLLLTAGADPLVRDLKHQDAADWAARGKNDALAQALRARVAQRLAARAQAAQNETPQNLPAQASLPPPASQSRAPARGWDAQEGVRHRVQGTSNVRFGD